VKWDEVAEHMHIKSVLRDREQGSDPRMAADSRHIDDVSDGLDVRERARRRAAAEKELKAIFERTYGERKQYHHSGRTERDFSAKPELSKEEAERNAARNAEIRAKHERKTAESEELQTLILIDGYNLIFSDAYLKELAGEDIGSARDQLIERLKNYAGYTGFEVNVIFDAYKVVPGAGSTEDHNGVTVTYTAQEEPADIRIGKMINSIKDRRVYAVSSDELVQQDAWSHGALRLSSREFMKLLDSTDEEVRDLIR
jgi:predicted RNA-binding protein with PIN domain